MRFKKGQQIACIVDKYGWRDDETHEPCEGPGMHEIVTADGYSTGYPNSVILFEYPHPDGYDDCCFVPLVSDEVLRKELETVPEPYTL